MKNEPDTKKEKGLESLKSSQNAKHINEAKETIDATKPDKLKDKSKTHKIKSDKYMVL